MRSYQWTLVGLLVAATAMSTAFCSSAGVTASDAKAAQKPLVDQGLANRGKVSANGIIEPMGREASLALDVPGRVIEILVHEGDAVQAGAVLARLDDAIERASVRSAESDVSVARAELSRVAHGVRAEDVAALTAEAASAKARSLQSTDSLARSIELAKSGAASPAEQRRAELDQERDHALYLASDARRRAAAAGSRADDIAVSRSRLAAAESRLEQARTQLAQKTLRAPWSGTVLQVKLRVGERYSPEREGLITLGDISSLVARIDIDERDLAYAKVGARAYVTIPAIPGKRIEGKVSSIGRRMGRKNVRTDDPVERIDSKILEVEVALQRHEDLMPGLRVVGYLE
jgi:HlyD family secretion protein